MTALLAVSMLMAFAANTQGESNESVLRLMPANPHLHSYEVVSYPERLVIFRDNEQICVVHSAKPYIERWGFIDSGNYIVVRSRDNEDATAIELFDTATGARSSTLMMPIDNHKQSPAWAADFLE